MEVSFPALAHRVTVFGSTLNNFATSAGVSSASSFWAFIYPPIHGRKSAPAGGGFGGSPADTHFEPFNDASYRERREWLIRGVLGGRVPRAPSHDR